LIHKSSRGAARCSLLAEASWRFSVQPRHDSLRAEAALEAAGRNGRGCSRSDFRYVTLLSNLSYFLAAQSQPDCRSCRGVKRPSRATRDLHREIGRSGDREIGRSGVVRGFCCSVRLWRACHASLLLGLAVSAAAARTQISLAELPISRSPCKIRGRTQRVG
jgi:hypothetical protein